MIHADGGRSLYVCAVAAANAISDIYAMGARPLFALNLVNFPIDTLPASVLGEILRGGAEKAAEAGVVIGGGHSIEDPEPKYGMTVTGVAHPEAIVRNRGAKPRFPVLTNPGQRHHHDGAQGWSRATRGRGCMWR
jgi:selenium donor protein